MVAENLVISGLSGPFSTVNGRYVLIDEPEQVYRKQDCDDAIEIAVSGGSGEFQNRSGVSESKLLSRTSIAARIFRDTTRKSRMWRHRCVTSSLSSRDFTRDVGLVNTLSGSCSRCSRAAVRQQV